MRTLDVVEMFFPSLPITGWSWIVRRGTQLTAHHPPSCHPVALTPSRPPASDEELISRIAGRDEVAFAEIYDRFAPRLLGLASAVLKDRIEAEDVIQESFLFLWNKAGQFDSSRASAFTWMALTVRHRSIDRLRSLARRNPERLENAGFDESSSATPLPPDLAASEHDRHLKAKSLLNTLPEEQRKMLGLAFLQGLTHSEISSRLNLPLGSVKTAIRRGLQRLRGSHESTPEDTP